MLCATSKKLSILRSFSEDPFDMWAWALCKIMSLYIRTCFNEHVLWCCPLDLRFVRVRVTLRIFQSVSSRLKKNSLVFDYSGNGGRKNYVSKNAPWQLLRFLTTIPVSNILLRIYFYTAEDVCGCFDLQLQSSLKENCSISMRDLGLNTGKIWIFFCFVFFFLSCMP